MKKKGIIVAIFFGVIMTTSLAAGVLLNRTPLPSEDNPDVTITGTPADNFPDAQRAQFCSSGNPKSTQFVKEYRIPTPCTSPLAIVTDYDGNVWFAQTNTGKLAKFDPQTQSFTEFDNPSWPKGGRSMMWGIDYSPDGSVWFTDEAYDSLWKFSTDTQKYHRVAYPSEDKSLPQRLLVDGSKIIVNDFTGNKITFFDPTQTGKDLNYLTLPSPVDNSVTAGFAVDANDNVWYTNWLYLQGGVLVKYDYSGFQKSEANSGDDSLPLADFITVFQLPPEILTPNGAVVSEDGKIWLADTSSSHVFSFDPDTEQFTQYVTSEPQLVTYGNATGIIKTPISRPYWIDVDSAGKLVFNEQTSNNIAVMDPKAGSLVEYSVPSRNPNWGDCTNITDCGLAQVFDFAIDGTKIWFTEWVENNIGVVDTSVALPMSVELSSDNISMKAGETKTLNFSISPHSGKDISEVSLVVADTSDFLNVVTDSPKTFDLNSDSPKTIKASISATDDITPGTYRVLLGAQTDDVAVSKFVTLTIEP